MTKDGFFPSTLTINQGDTVIFTTQLDQAFWPASDPHPTHDIYPEFDPKHPVDPDKSWSFKFDRIGSWKFHNHLDPSSRGVINVLDRNGSAVKINCNDPQQNDKIQCWEDSLDNTLETKGLDVAFQQLAQLYESDPYFAANCHGFVHRLGQAAYERFSQHQDIKLSPKTSYCAYGFYHGFMEALLKKTGDPSKAKEFCDYAQKQLSGQTSDAGGACFHGIGHGTVDGDDTEAWGDPEKMIKPGLKICDGVASNPMERYRCISGAYNSIEILSHNDKYQLDELAKDPFSFCKTQPINNKEACYTNMLPAIEILYRENFKEEVKKIETIPSDGDKENLELFGYTVKEMTAVSLFHEYIRLHTRSQDFDILDGINLCHSVSGDLRLPCVEGLAGGHMKYGEPGKEYVKGLAFCKRPELKDDERNECYRYILTRLSIWYNSQKRTEICSSVDKDYQKFCSGQ